MNFKSKPSILICELVNYLKLYYMKHFLFSSALIFTGSTLFAQDTTNIKVLSEVVISTSRSEKEAFTEPRSVTVINAQQIAASNVKTLPELLSQIESIYIAGNGMNPGGNQSVSMRGTNTNQTAILLDGISLNDPSSPNNSFDIGDLTLNSVERIEIVRGSNSTIYGSGAIGGSINIITKAKGDKPFEANADFRFGSDYNVANAMIRYTDKSGIYASLGLNSIASKGFDATMDTSSIKPLEPHDMDQFQQIDLIGKIGYEKQKFKISATAKSLQKFGDIDKGAFTNDNNFTLETKRNISHLKAQYEFNKKLSLQASIASSKNTRTSIDDSSLTAKSPDITDHTYFKGIFTGSNLQSELLGIYTLENLRTAIGIGNNKEKMNNETQYDYNDPSFPFHTKLNYKDSNLTQQNNYAFFHSDYNFKKQGSKELSLAFGLRYNNHNQYGNTISYEISPSYTKNGNTIYFSHTNGFLNPSLYQLYANDPSSMLYGNKNLKPQSSKSNEFGFKTIIEKSVYFTVAFFKIETKNPIQFVNQWNKNTPVDSLSYADFIGNTYLNLGTQNNSGVDFSLTVKASSQISMAFRYSYVVSKLQATLHNIDSNATQGNHIQLYEGGAFLTSESEEVKVLRRPTNTLNAILNYTPSSTVCFRLDTRYTSQRFEGVYNPNLGPFGALDSKVLNGYTLMDFYAKYFITNSISLGFKIDNLLNTKYTEIIGYRTRGTAYFFDLQVKL